MSGMDIVGLVLRWTHILSAIAAGGAMIFIRFALLPAIDAVLEDETKSRLHRALRDRWTPFLRGAIALLLVSGLVNVTLVSTRFKLPTPYHPVFGVKFILALGIFFIASVLMGKSPAFEPMRKKARFWVSVNLCLLLAIVCLSGYLRLLGEKKTLKSEKSDTSLQIQAEIGESFLPRL